MGIWYTIGMRANRSRATFDNMKLLQWSCEYTDTFAGEANYAWVRRGTALVPDGSTRTRTVRAIKSALNLTGVRCRTFDYGDMIELRPVGSCTVAFATLRY